jgi:hypothetical protein
MKYINISGINCLRPSFHGTSDWPKLQVMAGLYTSTIVGARELVLIKRSPEKLTVGFGSRL